MRGDQGFLQILLYGLTAGIFPLAQQFGPQTYPLPSPFLESDRITTSPEPSQGPELLLNVSANPTVPDSRQKIPSSPEPSRVTQSSAGPLPESFPFQSLIVLPDIAFPVTDISDDGPESTPVIVFSRMPDASSIPRPIQIHCGSFEERNTLQESEKKLFNVDSMTIEDPHTFTQFTSIAEGALYSTYRYGQTSLIYSVPVSMDGR